MHYLGPAPVDFADVHALNRAFLALLERDPNASQFTTGLADDLAAQLLSLTAAQTERLATAPFLLFSLRQEDRRLWDEIQSGEPRPDLFADNAGSYPAARVISAALGFLWRLARQNPYALRVVSGVSLNWCERLAEQALVDVIECASTRDDLLVLRAAGNANVWGKLLTGGVLQRESLRAASQLSALQMMLAGLTDGSSVRWATAACRSRFPSLGVAEKQKR